MLQERNPKSSYLQGWLLLRDVREGFRPLSQALRDLAYAHLLFLCYHTVFLCMDWRV